jgi:hypothetical protein
MFKELCRRTTGALRWGTMGRKDAAELQAAISRAKAAPQHNNNNFAATVNMLAKQSFEAYGHNAGTLNPNEHLP